MADGTHGTARIANERERRHGRVIIEALTILCYVELLVIKMAERTERYRSIRHPVSGKRTAVRTIVHA